MSVSARALVSEQEFLSLPESTRPVELIDGEIIKAPTKRFMYAEAGVKEYWIVDPAGVVERRSGPGLVRVEVLDATLTSELLPGFELDVATLMR